MAHEFQVHRDPCTLHTAGLLSEIRVRMVYVDVANSLVDQVQSTDLDPDPAVQFEVEVRK